ncbi:MAG: hypothetical protein V9G12_26150 [Microthrixaceae bacterium]
MRVDRGVDHVDGAAESAPSSASPSSARSNEAPITAAVASTSSTSGASDGDPRGDEALHPRRRRRSAHVAGPAAVLVDHQIARGEQVPHRLAEEQGVARAV